jgi:hypothetical protein
MRCAYVVRAKQEALTKEARQVIAEMGTLDILFGMRTYGERT